VQVDFDLGTEGEHYATRSKIWGIKSTASAGMMTTIPEGSLSWMKQSDLDSTCRNEVESNAGLELGMVVASLRRHW
jgi:hypothetical protein